MQDRMKSCLPLAALVPFVWATVGFAALQSPAAADYPSSVVVAQYLAYK